MLSDYHITRLQKKVALSEDDFALCEACRILGDLNRYRMMRALIEVGELCVSDISHILEISMSATSQHLRVLEMSGLVEGERMGQTICYRPLTRHANVRALIKLIK